MLLVRLPVLVSVVFGCFTLFVSVHAFAVSLYYAGDLVTDSLRFGAILISVGTGLVFLLPHRTIPAIREIARRVGKDPLRLVFLTIMLLSVLIALLSQAVTVWMAGPVLIGFFLTFVIPGFAYGGLTFPEPRILGSREVGHLAGQLLKRNPRYRRICIAIWTPFTISMLAFLFSPRAIPSPLWSSVSAWLALGLAGITTVTMVVPAWAAIPATSRAPMLPRVVGVGAFLLILSLFGYRALLMDLLPSGLGHITGHAVEREFAVLEVTPRKTRNDCRGSLEIQTPAGSREICNLPSGFLETLTPGDAVVISGRMTDLGQTIETVRASD